MALDAVGITERTTTGEKRGVEMRRIQYRTCWVVCVFAVACVVANAATFVEVSVPEDEWDYVVKVQTPAGLLKYHVPMPGPQLRGTEIKARAPEKFVVFTQQQAARIGAELAIRGKVEFLVGVLTTTILADEKDGNRPLDAPTGAELEVCLRTPGVEHALHLHLPGTQRRADVSDETVRLVFTPVQGTAIYNQLAPDLTIPEIAAVISGFEISKSESVNPQTPDEPIIAGCGRCVEGRTCPSGDDCCLGGTRSCLSCTLCPSLLTLVLFR